MIHTVYKNTVSVDALQLYLKCGSTSSPTHFFSLSPPPTYSLPPSTCGVAIMNFLESVMKVSLYLHTLTHLLPPTHPTTHTQSSTPLISRRTLINSKTKQLQANIPRHRDTKPVLPASLPTAPELTPGTLQKSSPASRHNGHSDKTILWRNCFVSPERRPKSDRFQRLTSEMSSFAAPWTWNIQNNPHLSLFICVITCNNHNIYHNTSPFPLRCICITEPDHTVQYEPLLLFIRVKTTIYT